MSFNADRLLETVRDRDSSHYSNPVSSDNLNRFIETCSSRDEFPTSSRAITARTLLLVSINFTLLMQKIRTFYEVGLTGWTKYTSQLDTSVSTELRIKLDAAIIADILICILKFKLSLYLKIARPEAVPNVSETMMVNMPWWSTEIPASMCYIIDKFGVANPRDIHTNPTYLHSPRPGTHNEYTPELYLSRMSQATAIFERFRNCEVPFRTPTRYSGLRTCWDSLTVICTESQYYVQSTLPRVNYNLPLDVFLAITLNGASSVNPGHVPIPSYAPRYGMIRNRHILRTIIETPLSHDPDYIDQLDELESTYVPNERSLASHDLVSPCGFLPSCHPSGIQMGPSDASGHSEASHSQNSIYILGRGGMNSVAALDLVGNGISTTLVRNFVRKVIRSKN